MSIWGVWVRRNLLWQSLLSTQGRLRQWQAHLSSAHRLLQVVWQSHGLSLSLCLSLSVCLSLSLSVCLSVSFSLTLSVCLSGSVSVSLCLSLSLSRSLLSIFGYYCQWRDFQIVHNKCLPWCYMKCLARASKPQNNSAGNIGTIFVENKIPNPSNCLIKS